MKITELKEGDVVNVRGIPCLKEGKHKVILFRKVPALKCSDGFHLLDGQIGKDGHLLGVYWS